MGKKELCVVKFWGKYFPLSNFYIEVDGLSVEHRYQAAKTEDTLWQQKILTAPSPGEAKRLGRRSPLRADWELIKVNVMIKEVRRKFKDPFLANFLLETGKMPLVEGNDWHDNYWGVCVCYKCRLIDGENHLGRILMKIRRKLRKKS